MRGGGFSHHVAFGGVAVLIFVLNLLKKHVPRMKVTFESQPPRGALSARSGKPSALASPAPLRNCGLCPCPCGRLWRASRRAGLSRFSRFVRLAGVGFQFDVEKLTKNVEKLTEMCKN